MTPQKTDMPDKIENALSYLVEMANEGLSHHMQRGDPERAANTIRTTHKSREAELLAVIRDLAGVLELYSNAQHYNNGPDILRKHADIIKQAREIE